MKQKIKAFTEQIADIFLPKLFFFLSFHLAQHLVPASAKKKKKIYNNHYNLYVTQRKNWNLEDFTFFFLLRTSL